jgi:hypothetical protein
MTLEKTELINLGVKHVYDQDSHNLYFGVASLKSKYNGLHIKEIDIVLKEIDGKEVKAILLSDVNSDNAELKKADNE